MDHSKNSACLILSIGAFLKGLAETDNFCVSVRLPFCVFPPLFRLTFTNIQQACIPFPANTVLVFQFPQLDLSPSISINN